MLYLRVFPFSLFVFTLALFVVLAFPLCFFFEPKIDEQNVKKRPWRLFLGRFARLKRNLKFSFKFEGARKFENLMHGYIEALGATVHGALVHACTAYNSRMLAKNSKREKLLNSCSKTQMLI